MVNSSTTGRQNKKKIIWNSTVENGRKSVKTIVINVV